MSARLAPTMAAVVRLTSILLGCWISEVAYAAALPTAYDAWPLWPYQSAQNWGHRAAHAWQPHGEDPGPRQFHPNLPLNPNAAKNIARGKVPPVKPQTNDAKARPRTFEIKFQGPISNTEDRKGDHDHSHGSSLFHHGSQFDSPSRIPSNTGPFNDPSKDSQSSSKPGFHFSLSVPLATTAAPKFPGGLVNSKYSRFSNTGSSQTRLFDYPHHMPEVNKPVYQNPTAQKPAEGKLVTFLSGLFNQREQGSQSNTQTQQNQVFFKPVAQQQPSAQSGSGHRHTPTDYWMSQMDVPSSTDAGSVQNPSHQAVQNTVHYSPQWVPFTSLSSDGSDVRNSILQSAKYINGQLMIPLEKCPGFERFAAHVPRHHHDHGPHHQHHHHHQGHGPHHQHHHHHQGHGPHHQHHHHQGHGPHHHHQHLQHPHHPHHHQGHGPHHQHPQHPHHPHHHQGHGPHHQHHHSPSRPTKPHYTKFFLNMEGTAPNPNEGTNVQQSGAYHGGLFRRWPGVNSVSASQQSVMKPGHTNYAVELGANVRYDKLPGKQSQKDFSNALPRRWHS